MLGVRPGVQQREEQESSGLVHWPVPLPAPRVPEGSRLVFPSEASRAKQQRACEAKVEEGCTKGLRAACSLQAARQCAPPPLLALLGLAPRPSWEEREACQEACMASCLEQQRPACEQHARAFCAEAFSGPAAGEQAREPTQQQQRQQRQQRS